MNATIFEANSSARASSSTSMIQKPARDSFDSANGPSVGTGIPSSITTVFAWVASASPASMTCSPDSLRSMSTWVMNSIISLIQSSDLVSIKVA